jgi:RNA-binding protein
LEATFFDPEEPGEHQPLRIQIVFQVDEITRLTNCPRLDRSQNILANRTESNRPRKIVPCEALSIRQKDCMQLHLYEMKGFQKAYLRALGKALDPTVIVGKGGLTPEVMGEVHRAFERQELIKVKFTAFKLKDEKDEMAHSIARQTEAFMAGMVGHTALYFKEASDEDRREIHIPEDTEGELVGAGNGKAAQQTAGK